jgi:hypothetical protein
LWGLALSNYEAFLNQKSQIGTTDGFEPITLPDFLFDFQRDIVDWAVRRGRAAIFADCGMGKTPMQLVWSENVVRETNKPVLIATPLAVSYQLLEEAEKFDIEAVRVSDGRVPNGARIVTTNYERLDRFDSSQFSGMVADESSILKNFNGARKAIVTEFMRPLRYRLLCTATAAPNDYIELGTSSEALGELGYMDMLGRFFRTTTSSVSAERRYYGKAAQWRFKGHAEGPFWQWVSSWARAIRKPSDYGYEDDGFVLPALTENEHIVEASTVREGMLFDLPAVTLEEQREERKRTIQERCEAVARMVEGSQQALVWCHLNDEGDLLTDLIPNAKQVAGSHNDDVKEERLMAFAHGELPVLVTKPKIGAWGLNLQRCNHVTFFPSHSYEQYYQGVRRCWRFGQKNPVTVDIVATEGERRVVENLKRKATQADRMFDALLEHMKDALQIKRTEHNHDTETEIPEWL